MTYTLVDLLQNLAAVVAFSPLLLAPGYLLAQTSDLLAFRRRSGPEQVLWSLVLSLPLSLVLASVLGRYLPSSVITGLFLAFAVAALGSFLFTRSRSAERSRYSEGSLRLPLVAMAALVGYLVLVTISVQIGPHLFESVNASDWSVRVPLVSASIRNGVPPGNPFFTLDHDPQGSRYYFYWYALCAQAARLTGLPARACLAGSVVWTALALVSLLLLSLKYLVGASGAVLRRYALLALALCCVLGLDVIPALLGLLTRPRHLYPEIEWWHGDRIPSFIGAVVFAPHHIGGMVCAILGLLVLMLSSAELPGSPERPEAKVYWRRPLLAAVFAGVCFAATAGASTYVALCITFAALFYGLDLLRRRRWVDLAALLLAGAFALMLSLPFLHAMLSGPALPTQPGHNRSRFFHLIPRELEDGARFAAFVSRRLHHEVTNRHLLHLLALPFAIVAIPLEFGFFLFPLAIRIRRDVARLRARESFPAGERLLWAIFLGVLIPYLFISSEPTQGTNDLGRHAALIVRFVVILWSTPIVAEYLDRLRLRQPLSPRHPLLATTATVFLALGIVSELWQVVVDRGLLVFTHYTHTHIEQPFSDDADFGGRYYDLRRGLESVEAGLPANAVVQSNPGSRYQMIVMLYSHRPFAAGDVSCETAFGGDIRQCKPMVRQLEHLYGGPQDIQPRALGPFVTVTAPDAVQTTTSAAFLATCHDQHLAALVAQNSDPAWRIPASWVWQQTPVYATGIVRIFACPAESSVP